MSQKLDYSRFKREINLTRYAAHIGYEIDPKKSTRSSVVMRSAADKVIISRRGNIWIYFSVTDERDNGTIINFIENRTGKSISEIGQELQKWIGEGACMPEAKNYVREIEEQAFDPERVRKIFSRCTPAKRHPYLESRGINPAVLQSERFSECIFSDRYGNAAFPHFDDQGVCGLELKNTDKSLFVRGSRKTLWRSKSRAGDETLVISEAVIDALSHYVLFPSGEASYAATGGGMSPEQAEILIALLRQSAALKRITLITDNDEGGDRLAEKLSETITKSRFAGKVIRHSPETRGLDWNDVRRRDLNPRPTHYEFYYGNCYRVFYVVLCSLFCHYNQLI